MSLVRGDALRLPMRDESVDLIVTSPPYFALRSYQDDGGHYDGQIGSEPTPAAFLDALWAATAEMVRVLKPSGSLFVNLGDKYAGSGRALGAAGLDPMDGRSSTLNSKVKGLSQKREPVDTGGIPVKSLMGLPWRYAIGCIDHLNLILRAEIIWSKPNGLPESVTDRVRRSHEQWFHLTREPRYYSAVDEIRDEYAPASIAAYERGGLATSVGDATHPSKANGQRQRRDGAEESWRGNPLGKLPGSVWTVPSEPLRVPDWVGVDHFAAFPQEWPRRLILGWSPPGICQGCGEGRRPVVDKELRVLHEQSNRRFVSDLSTDLKPRTDGLHGPTRKVGVNEATITGYVCACTTPDAPTRPAVVLDPFAGTGTVPMVARALGRTGIGVDLSADYLRLAHWRIANGSAKTVARTNLERQGSLL